MALDIALDPHGTGMPARYWRITQAHIDHGQAQATVWLHGWRDAAARRDGRTPAGSLTLTLSPADLPGGDLHQATTAALYRALMARAASAAAEADPAQFAEAGIGHAALAAAKEC